MFRTPLPKKISSQNSQSSSVDRKNQIFEDDGDDLQDDRDRQRGPTVDPLCLGDQSTNWGGFHQHFTSSFYARRSQKRKKIQSSPQSSLCLWDLHT